MGCCVERECEAGVKVIVKAYSMEFVGVFVCCKNEVIGVKEYYVVEYSEIFEFLVMVKDKKMGEFKFNVVNIALYYFLFDFLSRCCLDIVFLYYVVCKKILYLDVNMGKIIELLLLNGIKFEVFIFDTYKYAKFVCVVCGDRAFDFVFVKNVEGVGKDFFDIVCEVILFFYVCWIL